MAVGGDFGARVTLCPARMTRRNRFEKPCQAGASGFCVVAEAKIEKEIARGADLAAESRIKLARQDPVPHSWTPATVPSRNDCHERGFI